jgi:hypothetical protein
MKLNKKQLRKLILQEADRYIRRPAAAPVAATEMLPTEHTYEDLSLDAKKAHDDPTTKDKTVFMAGYNEGADDAAYDKSYNPRYKPVPNTPDTAMDDLTLGYSYGYSSFDMDGVDIHPQGSASNLETGEYEIYDASHFMGEARRANQLTRAQLRSLLQEMWNMSSEDMLKSGQLEGKLKSDMQELLGEAIMMGASIDMISNAVSVSINTAMNLKTGGSGTYQVDITENLGDDRSPSVIDDMINELIPQTGASGYNKNAAIALDALRKLRSESRK